MAKKLLYLLITSLLFSCKESSSNAEEQVQSFYQEQPQPKILPDDIETITPEEAKTYYKNKEYKYEYRTGYSGNYEYNYDVVGYDEDENEITGNINIEGKYGAGKITTKKGKTYDIEVEWYDYGKLKGTDENGTTYELTVE